MRCAVSITSSFVLELGVIFLPSSRVEYPRRMILGNSLEAAWIQPNLKIEYAWSLVTSTSYYVLAELLFESQWSWQSWVWSWLLWSGWEPCHATSALMVLAALNVCQFGTRKRCRGLAAGILLSGPQFGNTINLFSYESIVQPWPSDVRVWEVTPCKRGKLSVM